MRASLNLAPIGEQFQISGKFVDAYPFGNGHINATYLATYRGKTGERRYIHQRINDRVFTDIVCRHVRAKLEAEGIGDLERHVLTLVRAGIPTNSGESVIRDEHGYWWRTYEFIEGGTAHEFVDSPVRARAVGRAYGGFLRALRDLAPSELHETLPGFHDTYKRFATLTAAISEDSCKRALNVTTEITYCLQNAHLAQQLEKLREAGSARVCVTHNDTKINNVLIDDVTGEGICVIDLDTVMPGLALYDFGDIVRTATTPAAEDEADLSKVRVDVQMFESAARGYIEMAGDALLHTEIDHLVTAGKVITFESGIRFLADYLMGDVYFRVKTADHNLRRARTQFALVRSLQAHENELREIVKRIVAEQ
jgi:Phosphotransferase enzyme family